MKRSAFGKPVGLPRNPAGGRPKPGATKPGVQQTDYTSDVNAPNPIGGGKYDGPSSQWPKGNE
jgi:hypothetical protein